MNEQDDQHQKNREQDFSEFAKDRSPPREDKGGAFLRGCGIAFGVVVLVFLFIVGACFIGVSR